MLSCDICLFISSNADVDFFGTRSHVLASRRTLEDDSAARMALSELKLLRARHFCLRFFIFIFIFNKQIIFRIKIKKHKTFVQHTWQSAIKNLTVDARSFTTSVDKISNVTRFVSSLKHLMKARMLGERCLISGLFQAWLRHSCGFMARKDVWSSMAICLARSLISTSESCSRH